MSTLTEQVANLVTATDSLTGEVIGKLGQINSELDAKKAEIDTYWSNKSDQIDTDWQNKEIEINQRLEDFDNLVFYAKPTQSGTADGLSSANATTLQDILDNKLVNSVVNKVYLSSGLHILNSGTTIENYYLVHFLPEGTYNNLNPPIIITPSTTDADISRDEIGNPSPSQVCTAHDSDEYPLLIKNSTVVIENIRFRGTRHALRLEKSTATISGIIHFDVWVFSISCTAHRGVGLYCVDSKVYGSGQWHINIYHPDYTACSDVLNNYAAPIVCERSELLLHNRIEWKGNIPVAELPTENITDYRATVDSSPRTCINARDKSYVRIENLAYKGCIQLFYAENQSVIDVQYLEAVVGTEPVRWIGQVVNHSKLRLTNQFDDWPSDDLKKIKIENTGNVTENASLIANEKSEIYLDGVEIRGICACSTFITLDKKSELYAENSIISAENRDGNLGFFKILQSYTSDAYLKDLTLITRNGDSDTAVTTESGRTVSINNSITTTTRHEEKDYGLFIEDGIVHGNHSFNEDKHFSVPNDFSSLNEAIDFVSKQTWPSNVTVYIDIGSGTYTSDTVTHIGNISSPLVISGADIIEKNITAFVSVSGSQANYSVTLQLDNVTGLLVDYYVLIDPGTITGTNAYRELGGCFKITNIAGSNVTLLHTSNKGAFPNSPAITITAGKLQFFPTLLKYQTYSGFAINNSKVDINNLAMVGNHSSFYASIVSGIHVRDANVTLTYVGISNFSKGIASRSGTVSAYFSGVTKCYKGVHSFDSGQMQIYRTSTSGNVVGILATKNSVIEASECFSFGNTNFDVIAMSGSFIQFGTSIGAYADNYSPLQNTVGNSNGYISGVHEGIYL